MCSRCPHAGLRTTTSSSRTPRAVVVMGASSAGAGPTGPTGSTPGDYPASGSSPRPITGSTLGAGGGPTGALLSPLLLRTSCHGHGARSNRACACFLAVQHRRRGGRLWRRRRGGRPWRRRWRCWRRPPRRLVVVARAAHAAGHCRRRPRLAVRQPPLPVQGAPAGVRASLSSGRASGNAAHSVCACTVGAWLHSPSRSTPSPWPRTRRPAPSAAASLRVRAQRRRAHRSKPRRHAGQACVLVRACTLQWARR